MRLSGVPFGICDVTSVHTDMNEDGSRDRVFVFAMQGAGGCESRTAFVGLQRDGVGPVAWSESAALRCERHCAVLATPAIGGHHVVVVSTSRTSSIYEFELFGAVKDQIAPAPISLPARKGSRLLLGGSQQSVFGLQCVGDLLDIWGAAGVQEGQGPFDVEQTYYRLRRNSLVRVRATHASLPQDQASMLPQHGGLPFGAPKVLCGSRLIHDPLPHTPE